MPCHDWGSGPPHNYNEELLQSKIDKLTRLLCEAGKMFEDFKAFDEYFAPSEELTIWWKEHRKLDKARNRKKRKG